MLRPAALPGSQAGASSARLRGLAACGALAAALHLALLSLSGAPTSVYLPRHSGAAVVPVQLRAVTAGSSHRTPAPTGQGVPSHALDEPAVAPPAAAASAAATANDTQAAPLSGPLPTVAPGGPAAAPEAASDDNDPGFDAYLPTSILSMTPAPTVPVDIPYPAFDGDAGRYRAQLTLFIDELGLVQRIDTGLGDLPPALEAAVRRTFMAARFRAGEVDGVPVRSRVRIEVRFDSTPLRR